MTTKRGRLLSVNRKKLHKRTRKFNPKVAKREQFVNGLVEGKSMVQAARDAGYSESTAMQASRAIMPHVQEAFQQALHHRISVGKLSDTIAAGLDAHETKVFSTKTGIQYSDPLIAWGERREYARLAANLMNLEPPKKLEHSGPDGGALRLEIVPVGIRALPQAPPINVKSVDITPSQPCGNGNGHNGNGNHGE